jgi:predicted phosphodiesterase
MLLALFADIHANRAALLACMEDARARGAERFAFLGDLVGYGPDPSEVLALIRGVSGALVIKGNHDEAVLVEPKLREMPYDHLATAARIRAAGLPDTLAHRIERGAL